jgi:hypothetical protein
LGAAVGRRFGGRAPGAALKMSRVCDAESLVCAILVTRASKRG